MKHVRIWGEALIHYGIAVVMGAIHGEYAGPMYLACIALFYALRHKEKLRAKE
jgi:hypothetical protein